jgi:hypothetical protein
VIRTHAARALAAALFVFFVCGCVSKPTMRLDHSELNGIQLATLPPSIGIQMTVVLAVTNPNGYDVAVRAVHGQTVMADKYPLPPVEFQAPGDGVWLPAKQTTLVRVPVMMPLPTALALLQEMMMAPTLSYRFTGRADVTATRTLAIQKDDYAVDERGTITREQMMAVVPAPFANMPMPFAPVPR